MVDALDHGLAVAGDSDRPLSAVGQHLTGHLDTCPSHLKLSLLHCVILTHPHHLSDFLDLAAALTNEGATLAGGDNQSKGDGGAGHSARADQIV